MADAPRLYFPGLNGIRAVAAVGVMLSHTLLALHRFPGHARHAGLHLANHGVIMFFTLSGFLITYLLLDERERFGRIDIKQFYVRRILRIWPLYFLYIALAMFFHWQYSGRVDNAPYVILFVFFLPNIAFNLGRYMPDTAPLWSIGIEEQFYAMWPLLISKVRRLKPLLFTIVVGLPIVRFVLHAALGSGKHLSTSIVDSLGYDAMALGALVAVLYRERNPILMRIAQSWGCAVAFALLVALHATNKLGFLSLLGQPLTSVVTAAFIVSQIALPERRLSLENPILNYLGRISFGIYVYHMLVISVLAALVNALEPSVLPTPVLVFGVLFATVGVATLSYRFLEAPFLRIKDRYARIKTATTAS